MSKLMMAAITLLHKKEEENWNNILHFLDNKNYKWPEEKGYSSTRIWFWSLKRWGKEFPTQEYNFRK